MVQRDVSGRVPDAQNWQPAPLLRRFGALLADWLLCVLIASLVADPRRSGWPPVAILVGEYGFFLGLFGRTPGMWITNLRCVGVDTGAPVGIPRAVLRGLLLALIVPALIMDPRRRGLHDRAAGTIVLAPAVPS